MFVYCNNNPIMYLDSAGNMAKKIAEISVGTIVAIVLGAGVIGAATSAIVSAATYYLTDEPTSEKGFWANIAGSAVSGFLSSVIAVPLFFFSCSTGTVVLVNAGAGAAGSLLGSMTKNAIMGSSLKEFIKDGASDLFWGGAGGALGGIVSGPSVGVSTGAQLAKALNKPIKKVAQKMFEDAIEELRDWFTKFVVEEWLERLFGSKEKQNEV